MFARRLARGWGSRRKPLLGVDLATIEFSNTMRKLAIEELRKGLSIDAER